MAASFLGSQADTGNTDNYTFSGVTFGTAASDRYIFVAIHTGDNADITSCTIGGVAATRAARNANATVGFQYIYTAPVPTGTTGDINVVLNSIQTRLGIGWYRVDSLSSATVFDSDSANASGTNATVSTSIDVPANGFAIGMTYGEGGTTGFSGWTLTERYDFDPESGQRMSGGMQEFADIQTGYTVSAVANSAGAVGSTILAASWAFAASTSNNKFFMFMPN